MAKALFVVFVPCLVILAVDAAAFEVEEILEIFNIESTTCSHEHETERIQFLLAASCRPHDVFIDLPPQQPHVAVNPNAVFVKRCMGICGGSRKRCLPTNRVIRKIPVRFSDVSNGQEWCGFYPVEEHLSCGCKKVAT